VVVTKHRKKQQEEKGMCFACGVHVFAYVLQFAAMEERIVCTLVRRCGMIEMGEP